jgi:hypothetical protein
MGGIFYCARHDDAIFAHDIFVVSRHELWNRRVLKRRKKIVRKFGFEPTISRAARVCDDELSRAELSRFSAIIENHPERADIVPETRQGRPMDAEFEI